MKNLIAFILLLAFAGTAFAQDKPIVIETKNTALVYKLGFGNKLVQVYYGEKLKNAADYEMMNSRNEAYKPAGLDNLNEPAIRMVHNDGNPSLALNFVSSEAKAENENVKTTVVVLKDDQYPVEVKLFFKTWFNEDIIENWTEIKHNEGKPVMLTNFASSMLSLKAREYWLTQFHGDWDKEMIMEESQLTSGIKIIDSKLGTRTNKFQEIGRAHV